MRQLIVGFSTDNNSIISKTIKRYMGAKFSHTYIEFKFDEFDNSTVFQAAPVGLQFISKQRFIKENEVIQEFVLHIPEDKYLEILNKCHEASGISYGFLQNLGVVLAKLFALKSNPFQDNANCSEWVARCLLIIDPNAFNEPNLVTPLDVHKYLTLTLLNN